MTHITASKLYDYLQCPHRVWRDIHGPQEKINQTIEIERNKIDEIIKKAIA